MKCRCNGFSAIMPFFTCFNDRKRDETTRKMWSRKWKEAEIKFAKYEYDYPMIRSPLLNINPSLSHDLNKLYCDDLSIYRMLLRIICKQNQIKNRRWNWHYDRIELLWRIVLRIYKWFIHTSTSFGSSIKTVNSEPIQSLENGPYLRIRLSNAI